MLKKKRRRRVIAIYRRHLKSNLRRILVFFIIPNSHLWSPFFSLSNSSKYLSYINPSRIFCTASLNVLEPGNSNNLCPPPTNINTPRIPHHKFLATINTSARPPPLSLLSHFAEPTWVPPRAHDCSQYTQFYVHKTHVATLIDLVV